MRYVFLNVIADGAVNWKLPLTAPGQPGIREYFMIVRGDDDGPQVIDEFDGSSCVHLVRYAELVASGYVVVGHSVDYHAGHVRAELVSRGIDPHDGQVQTICTMLSLTGHVPKFNGKRGWPTFAEACHHFGIERAAVESAEDNCRNLARIFSAMERLGIVPEPKVWRERNHG